MNRVLPFVLAAIPPALLTAQEPEPTGENHALQMMIQGELPALAAEDWQKLLFGIAQHEDAREIVGSAFNASGAVRFAGYRTELIVPGRQVLITVTYYLAAERQGLQRAGAAPVVKHFEERLSALFYRPAFEQRTKQMMQAEREWQTAEEASARAVAQLRSLGADDQAAESAAMVHLRQQLLGLEVDLRTEEAMQDRLQRQIAQCREELSVLGGERDAVSLRVDQLTGKLGELGALPDPQRGSDHAAKLADVERQIAHLQTQAADLDSRRARTGKLLSAATEQLTSSTLALQRHRSRKDVLEDLLGRQKKIVDEATARTIEREQLQRAAELARADADALRARVLDLRRQRDALQPVQVTSWQ